MFRLEQGLRESKKSKCLKKQYLFTNDKCHQKELDLVKTFFHAFQLRDRTIVKAK